ncbi:MAG: hypothetical protein ACXWWR_02695, partial [Candidatus Limnocylindrales bacterium]
VEAPPEVLVQAGAPAGGLVALPGEKLSKAALARREAAAPAVAADEAEAAGPAIADDGTELDADGPRRRRRRGGRGRGRGRGRGEGGELTDAPVEVDGAVEGTAKDDGDQPVELVASAPRGPRPGAFGSVWDSQIGQSRPPSSAEATRFDVDDDDEPAIPEYLIAEQRRGGSSNRAGGRSPGGNRGGRGGAYQVAMDRERYGRGGGGGINRYPDVSGRTAGGGTAGTIGRGGHDSHRDDRPPAASRPERERPAAGRSDEPWSEVPPELEALLRAQIATRGDRPVGSPKVTSTGGGAPAVTSAEVPTEAPARKPRGSTRTRVAAAAAAEVAPSPAEAASDGAPPKPKPRATTRTKTAASKAAGAAGDGPKPRAATRTKAAVASKAKPKAAATGEGGEAPAPKRRAPARKLAATSET